MNPLPAKSEPPCKISIKICAQIQCTVPQEYKPTDQRVVDGTIHAKVYTDSAFVGDVYFVLPRAGISPDGEAKTLHTLCTRALPNNGNDRIELGEESNLWLMEA